MKGCDMSDPMVLASQEWVNETFADVDGYEPCTESNRPLRQKLGCSPATELEHR